jgi:hypothetical protein
MKQSPILFDFAAEVLREKLAMHDPVLHPSDSLVANFDCPACRLSYDNVYIVMAKCNSQNNANRSALDFESPLWAASARVACLCNRKRLWSAWRQRRVDLATGGNRWKCE